MQDSPVLTRSSLFRLIGMEWLIARRTPTFRAVLIAALATGLLQGSTPGRGAAVSAYAAGELACLYISLLAIIWMALAAVRDAAMRTEILVFSKPQPAETLALARFAGGYLQMFAVIGALFIGASAARLVSGGGATGFAAYGGEFARAAAVVFFASSLSFSLALLLDNALAGVTSGLYWLLTLAGREFLAKFYFPAYTQNGPAFAALAAGLLLSALFVYRRRRRGATPAARWVRLGAPAFLATAMLLFRAVILNGHDPQARTQLVLDRMADQNREEMERAPGFDLPDQIGRVTGLSDYPGRIMVIALFSPQDTDSALLLDRLAAVQQRYGAQGVQPVAICISENQGTAATFARGEAVDFAVVSDWGTYNAPRGAEVSPLATAYRAVVLPLVVVTDRRRRVRADAVGGGAYDERNLARMVEARLAEEPK